MCKEEVLLHFRVLAAELWEQRANSNVLLSVLPDGWEKAPDRVQTVALLSRKRRKKKLKSVRMV